MLLILFFLLTFFACPAQSEYPNLIESIKISRNKVIIKPHQELKKFLRLSYFFVEYNHPEVDLNSLDFSIVTIPFITTIIPIVWFSGKTYTIETMDSDLFYALREIKKVFKQFYPFVSWKGDIVVKNLKKNHIDVRTHSTTAQGASAQGERLSPVRGERPSIHAAKLRTRDARGPQAKIAELGDKSKRTEDIYGVLFSGGLDAVASSFAHIEKDQLLITICGSDVKFYERELWQRIQKQTVEFAQAYNKNYSFIRSNFAQLAHGKILKKLSKLPQWWALTSQALHYTGLTAPLLFHYGIQHLIIGSSHTADLPMPYGSHPLIDNKISFAGICVYHNLGNLDRLQKIKLITKQCKKYTLASPGLRVCWGNDKKGGNCCECEKCLRTINELIVVGKNPQKFGFDISLEKAVEKTQNFFNKTLKLKARQLWHWDCVQKYIKNNKTKKKSELENYLHWIEQLNLVDYAKNSFELNSWKEQDPELAQQWNESIKSHNFLK